MIYFILGTITGLLMGIILVVLHGISAKTPIQHISNTSKKVQQSLKPKQKGYVIEPEVDQDALTKLLNDDE